MHWTGLTHKEEVFTAAYGPSGLAGALPPFRVVVVGGAAIEATGRAFNSTQSRCISSPARSTTVYSDTVYGRCRGWGFVSVWCKHHVGNSVPCSAAALVTS
jgi:hypothetical protein